MHVPIYWRLNQHHYTFGTTQQAGSTAHKAYLTLPRVTVIKPLQQTFLMHVLDAATTCTRVVQRRVILPGHSTDPTHILLVIRIPLCHHRPPLLHLFRGSRISSSSLHARHSRSFGSLHPVPRTTPAFPQRPSPLPQKTKLKKKKPQIRKKPEPKSPRRKKKQISPPKRNKKNNPRHHQRLPAPTRNQKKKRKQLIPHNLLWSLLQP
jgi:hypothetical protein